MDTKLFEEYEGKLSDFNDVLSTLTLHERKTLGFFDDNRPVWQQQKIIESPYWTLDTLAKIKMSYILGLNHQQVANLTQISSKTLMRWRKKSQELCLLIDHWKDQMEIIAKVSFLRLVTQGDKLAVMEAIKAKDVRYTKSYQSRCSVCKQNLISENERKEILRDSYLYTYVQKLKKRKEEEA